MTYLLILSARIMLLFFGLFDMSGKKHVKMIKIIIGIILIIIGIPVGLPLFLEYMAR